MGSQEQNRGGQTAGARVGAGLPAPRVLEQVRNVMRLHHYSIHTERSYTDWIKRYIHFHHMRSREDLANGESKIEAFCTDLAVNGKVSPSTQNQAFNALVFFYRQVLKLPLEEQINAVRAERKVNLPVVLTREEVVKVIALLEGEPQLIVKLLYGSGLRIMEAVRLRVKDVELAMKQVTVRSGKGDKDRFTTLPGSLVPLLQNQVQKVRVLHQQDLAAGHGSVYLPGALDRKYLSAAREWRWQYVFPARDLSKDPRSGVIRRHHLDEVTIHRAIKGAVARVGITKRVSSHTGRCAQLNRQIATDRTGDEASGETPLAARGTRALPTATE